MKAVIILALCLFIAGCKTDNRADSADKSGKTEQAEASAPVEETGGGEGTASTGAGEPAPSGGSSANRKYAASSSYDFGDVPKIDSMLNEIATGKRDRQGAK